MQNMILQILLPGTGRRYRKPITRRYSFRTRGACAVDHEGAIRSLSGHSRHLLDPSLPVMVVDLRTQHKPSHLRQFANCCVQSLCSVYFLLFIHGKPRPWGNPAVSLPIYRKKGCPMNDLTFTANPNSPGRRGGRGCSPYGLIEGELSESQIAMGQ